MEELQKEPVMHQVRPFHPVTGTLDDHGAEQLIALPQNKGRSLSQKKAAEQM